MRVRIAGRPAFEAIRALVEGLFMCAKQTDIAFRLLSAR
jgi:hypothetical protein